MFIFTSRHIVIDNDLFVCLFALHFSHIDLHTHSLTYPNLNCSFSFFFFCPVQYARLIGWIIKYVALSWKLVLRFQQNAKSKVYFPIEWDRGKNEKHLWIALWSHGQRTEIKQPWLCDEMHSVDSYEWILHWNAHVCVHWFDFHTHTQSDTFTLNAHFSVYLHQ